MKRKPSIAWCSPNYGSIDTQVYKNHLAAISNASRMFDVKYVGISDKMYLHSASNKLVTEALEMGVDYIFWTEQDMLLPFDVVTKLFERQKDICSGIYFLRGAAFMPCMWQFVENEKNPEKNPYMISPISLFTENSMLKIDVCGMGCVLFKSDVFRKLEEPWFDMKEGYGQDVYFYRKVKNAGIDVWVDTGIQCGQQAERKVTSIEDYREHLALSETNNTLKGFIMSSEVNRANT